MARNSKVLYYTVPDYADTLLVPIEASQDSEAAREKALDRILEIIESEEDTTLTQNSFPDGLGIDKLVLVEPPESKDSGKKRKSKKEFDRELQPIEIAAAEVAKFSMLRVELQKKQQEAFPYFKLVEAIFDSAPLTEEHMEMAASKTFTDTLKKLASTKVEFDTAHPKARDAWELLKPILVSVAAAQTEGEKKDEKKPPGPSATPPGQRSVQKPGQQKSTSEKNTPEKK